MKETFALLLAYDGSAFRGWQKQPGMATVQEAVEEALRDLLGKRYLLHGASRTDAGVHAVGQVASFQCGREADLSALRFPEALRLLRWARASPSFHARASSVGKRYRYDFAHFVQNAPDWERARAALRGLEGATELSGLCSPAKAHKPAEFFSYEAHHGFMNEARPDVHQAKAAEEAWGRTIAFLKKHLA